MHGWEKPDRIAAVMVALVLILLQGCINDPVEYGKYNTLIAELSLVWNTFDQKYVGFAEANVDWDRSWETALAEMDTVVSYPGLGRVIWRMLEPLQDPDVLIRYHTGWSPYPYDPQYPPNVDSLLHQQYMQDLGYEQIQEGWGYCMVADSTVPLFVITKWTGFSWGTFDEHFVPLLDSKGMIIDIRLAPTYRYYQQAMPKLIANRFADQLRPAYFRQWRTGPGREDLRDPLVCYLHPREGFTGPTLLLMGRQSIRLTERFVSMMGGLPHVTLVGDTTGGRADATQEYNVGGRLTDGIVQIPDTAILAWDTSRIQRHGIPPEVYVQADSEDFAQGVDPVLEYALDWAENL